MTRHIAIVFLAALLTACATLTGDLDYMLKIVVADLKALSRIINDELLPQEAVNNVRSSIAMETLKDDNLLPLS